MDSGALVRGGYAVKSSGDGATGEEEQPDGRPGQPSQANQIPHGGTEDLIVPVPRQTSESLYQICVNDA